jgi:arylsulfatase A-like enzyme
MGLWEEAYVILTSDHGEALCEHGHWGHGFSLHNPELQVPLILRWPGTLPAGKRVRHLVRLIDLMPTVLEQLRLPWSAGMQGASLVAVMEDRPPSGPAVAYAEGVKVGPEQRALYMDDWKLLTVVTTGRQSLYNVAEDPLEQRDLSAEQPARLQALGEMLREQAEINAELATGRGVEQVPLEDEEYQRLKSLGYVD